MVLWGFVVWGFFSVCALSYHIVMRRTRDNMNAHKYLQVLSLSPVKHLRQFMLTEYLSLNLAI